MIGARKPRLPLIEGAYGVVKQRLVHNYSEYCSGVPAKRALLSYLVHPLLLPSLLRDPAQFSNQGMAREIPRALNELGYAVDIIDYGNMEWQPKGKYDLLIGHANRNFTRLASQLQPTAKVIYFATGVHWRQQNTKAAQRLYDVAMRRGVLLPPERVSEPAEGDAYDKADAIICLGNAHAAASFSAYPRVYSMNNAAYPISTQLLARKDFVAGQKHFLFFSGLGNVHKGLDLLLEAFVGTDCHLHVCQHLQPDFARAFRKELSDHPNIHIHGFVKMRTSEFEQLARSCNWVILPTCAEGQPGSVLECMAYGLVPILPDTANIDLGSFGYRIESLDVQTLRTVCEAASESDPSDTSKRAFMVASEIQESYSVERFRDSFRHAVASITDEQSE